MSRIKNSHSQYESQPELIFKRDTALADSRLPGKPLPPELAHIREKFHKELEERPLKNWGRFLTKEGDVEAGPINRDTFFGAVETALVQNENRFLMFPNILTGEEQRLASVKAAKEAVMMVVNGESPSDDTAFVPEHTWQQGLSTATVKQIELQHYSLVDLLRLADLSASRNDDIHFGGGPKCSSFIATLIPILSELYERQGTNYESQRGKSPAEFKELCNTAVVMLDRYTLERGTSRPKLSGSSTRREALRVYLSSEGAEIARYWDSLRAP